MSKQLSISAAFSVFAMASFALFGPQENASLHDYEGTGAKAHASAPALDRLVPDFSLTAL